MVHNDRRLKIEKTSYLSQWTLKIRWVRVNVSPLLVFLSLMLDRTNKCLRLPGRCHQHISNDFWHFQNTLLGLKDHHSHRWVKSGDQMWLLESFPPFINFLWVRFILICIETRDGGCHSCSINVSRVLALLSWPMLVSTSVRSAQRRRSVKLSLWQSQVIYHCEEHF